MWSVFRYLVIFLAFSAGHVVPVSASRLVGAEEIGAAIAERDLQIGLLREQQHVLQQKIQGAEMEMQILMSVSDPAAEFETKNLIVGLRYDVGLWRDKLKQLQLEITALKRLNVVDRQRLQQLWQEVPQQQLAGPANDSRAVFADVVHNEKTVPDAAALEQIRQQQKRLIEQSYRMPPGEAALNLARARALEPLEMPPVLGDQVVLLNETSLQGATRLAGIMQHMGGNQYYLEAILKPGKQTFVIGGYRLEKLVTDEYAGVTCIILLDVSDRKKPVFQYFVK